ncbi:hypothetical protein CYMTET_30302 [Cymbomonas tetramitiformis]|uniref:Uncharacterized protein n=1 Tax=Cymbomonas tetramitiformis TaxID=36881 RepID=A0AAE0FJT6_9CHLO|nr:hypothetical protein CYMTET_30302 [Cymbomonas tetramitiformis]
MRGPTSARIGEMEQMESRLHSLHGDGVSNALITLGESTPLGGPETGGEAPDVMNEPAQEAQGGQRFGPSATVSASTGGPSLPRPTRGGSQCGNGHRGATG